MNILITEQTLRHLKRRYSRAVKQGKEQFTFQGAVLLTAYAKYLIQYLDGKVRKAQS